MVKSIFLGPNGNPDCDVYIDCDKKQWFSAHCEYTASGMSYINLFT